jgi:hypothetical protein
MNLQIYATNKSGHHQEITDLYWFEENGVHDWGGDGVTGKYSFTLFLDGEPIYPRVSGRIFGMPIILSDSLPDGEIKFGPPIFNNGFQLLDEEQA